MCDGLDTTRDPALVAGRDGIGVVAALEDAAALAALRADVRVCTGAGAGIRDEEAVGREEAPAGREGMAECVGTVRTEPARARGAEGLVAGGVNV